MNSELEAMRDAFEYHHPTAKVCRRVPQSEESMYVGTMREPFAHFREGWIAGKYWVAARSSQGHE